MVSIHFKLTDIGRLQVDIEKPEILAAVLRQCTAQKDFELGGIIAIRKGTVLKENDLVQDGDEIDIFPALSGG
jgi:molybdopterin converting factor small subunit